MKSHPQLLAVAATAITVLTALLPAQSQNVDSKPTYNPTGQEVTLTGSITFTGKVPEPRKIDMSADPVCYEGDPYPTTDWLLVRNGKVANVIVYVTGSVLDNYSFESPTTTVVLEHRSCRYQPHVLGIRTGQTLSVVNADDTHHNTHPYPKLHPEWNMTQPPGSPPIIKSFERPELAIPFRDNQHPWEKAYVAVFRHPYFSITDANGDYRIESLPPGQYEVIAWHEEMGEKRMDLTIVPGESRSVGFTFDRSDLKNSRLLQH
jgi:hypothetical protein